MALSREEPLAGVVVTITQANYQKEDPCQYHEPASTAPASAPLRRRDSKKNAMIPTSSKILRAAAIARPGVRPFAPVHASSPPDAASRNVVVQCRSVAEAPELGALVVYVVVLRAYAFFTWWTSASR